MVNYNLVYTKQARDKIEKLDPVVKKRLGRALERYRRNPFYYASRLKSSQIIGDFRWRVGDYRVIFDVDGRDLVILHVGHRRDIYDR